MEVASRIVGRFVSLMKSALGRQRVNPNIYAGRVVNLEQQRGSLCINGERGRYPEIESALFPAENFILSRQRIEVVPCKAMTLTKISVQDERRYMEALLAFIRQSQIPEGYRYAGFYHAGFSKKSAMWVLPSWIWTNAALARTFLVCGAEREAVALADLFLQYQRPEGGWIVRFDYRGDRVSQVMAPNDSSYIADNCLLPVYERTGEPKYLAAAEACARWIMASGMEGLSLPKTGYYEDTGEWEASVNIVDVGFTAALFCNLYRLTGNELYRDYAARFVADYVRLFYRGRGRLATSIDIRKGTQNTNGLFARGHAWALEGLIPYYEMTGDAEVRRCISEIVAFLVEEQSRTGGWRYNLARGVTGRFSGYDCKGIPVIAEALLRWNRIEPGPEVEDAVKRAVEWCRRHSYADGTSGAAGVFSYDFEGSVVYDHYSSTAFTYANAYLIRILNHGRS